MDIADLIGDIMETPRSIVEHPMDMASVGLPKMARAYLGVQGRKVTDASRGPRNLHSYVATHPDEPPFFEEELARPWLIRLHRAQRPKSGMAAKRIPWQSEALAHLERRPPAYFGGVVEGEVAYVDIDRAYPSIYERVGLDPRWRPGEVPRFALGRFAFAFGVDEMRHAKQAHRVIGGQIRATEITTWRHGRPEKVSSVGWSPFLAPDLWGVIMDALHVLADYAVRVCGAHSWWTDGGTMPADQVSRFVAFAADMGLSASVRLAGRGKVTGPCAYEIAGHLANEGRTFRPTNTISPPPSQASTLLISALEAL